MTYLRKKKRKKERAQPINTTHRCVAMGIDGKFRLFTQLSARHHGFIGDDSKDEEGRYLVSDYSVQCCIGVYDTEVQAHNNLKTKEVEGEWQ
jgi:hypothetical protein|tara:strand:+ start:415 stop:690 length:276 start_codon:yes stop_codon:yes gene_type:complete